MINSCIDSEEVFGVVLLRSGAETESEDTIHRVGVTARIVQVERLENGRLNILTEGEDRFRIRRFMAQEPYWKGLVDFFEDNESHPSIEVMQEEVSELYRKVAELGAKIDSTEEPETALPESPTDLSYMISYILDIDPEAKQKLLEMTSAAERLRSLVPHLTESIQKLQQQLALKEIMHKVRGNGDLGKPKNL